LQAIATIGNGSANALSLQSIARNISSRASGAQQNLFFGATGTIKTIKQM